MLQLYSLALRLDSPDKAWLGGRLAGHDAREEPAGLLRFRDWLRLHEAPHGDPALRRRLDADLTRCQRLVAELDARHPRRVASPDRLLPPVSAAGCRAGISQTPPIVQVVAADVT